MVSLLIANMLGVTATKADDAGSDSTAILIDTITPRTDKSADFFIVSEIDGDTVDNAASITTQADRGRGFAMTPRNYDRRIAAKPVTVKIEGLTHYAAPILQLLHGSREVGGEETLNPQPGHAYEIKGALQDDDCSVWIEDTATAELVGQKFSSKC
jgi:hypothetical protein